MEGKTGQHRFSRYPEKDAFDSKFVEAMSRHYMTSFVHHANQRLSSIRYFLTAYSIIVAGFVAYVRVSGSGTVPEYFSILLALGSWFFSILFARLDIRNEQIIHSLEKPLEEIQKLFQKLCANSDVWLSFQTSDTNKAFFGTHSKVVPWIFFVPAVISSFGCGFTVERALAATFPRFLYADCAGAVVVTVLSVLGVFACFFKPTDFDPREGEEIA